MYTNTVRWNWIIVFQRICQSLIRKISQSNAINAMTSFTLFISLFFYINLYKENIFRLWCFGSFIFLVSNNTWFFFWLFSPTFLINSIKNHWNIDSERPKVFIFNTFYKMLYTYSKFYIGWDIFEWHSIKNTLEQIFLFIFIFILIFCCHF